MAQYPGYAPQQYAPQGGFPAAPQRGQPPLQVHVKGVLFGKYLWRCEDGSVVLSYIPKPWTIEFDWEGAGDLCKISYNGYYLEPEGTIHGVRATETQPKADHAWRVHKLDPTGFRVGLMSIKENKFLSCTPDNTVHSHAKKLDVGEHFQFELVNNPPLVGPPFGYAHTKLRASIKNVQYATFLHKFPDAKIGLAPLPQVFTIDYHGSDQISIEDNGTFFRSKKNGTIDCETPVREDWHTFYLRRVAGTHLFLILDHHNAFFCAKKDNTLVAKHNYEAEACDDEKFEIIPSN